MSAVILAAVAARVVADLRWPLAVMLALLVVGPELPARPSPSEAAGAGHGQDGRLTAYLEARAGGPRLEASGQR